MNRYLWRVKKVSHEITLSCYNVLLASLKESFQDIENVIIFLLHIDKTLSLKGEQCSGDTKSIEKLTAMIDVMLLNQEKLLLFVINKSLKPAVFKILKSWVECRANKECG